MLPQHPSPDGQHLYAEILLVQGDFEAGWRQFEFRWFHHTLDGKRAWYGRPEWDGQPLGGRTVLVQAEQGIGDVVMFARYLPMLKARGARVLFLPRRDMAGLARTLPGVDEVLDDGQALPEFDYVAYLMSLPRAFGTRLQTVPWDGPYVVADAARAARWAAEIPARGRLRVGLVWAGRPTQENDQRRSLHLRDLEPLLRVRDIDFFSLQKGRAEDQLDSVSNEVRPRHLGSRFDSLEDLVAAMSHLDLIVSVCTGPAHIAGAMGKPVWTMIADPPDFRWMTGREDSPWYPTMRLFRQAQPGAWTPVIASVASALASEAAAAPRYTAPRVSRPAIAHDVDGADAGMTRIACTRHGWMIVDPEDPSGVDLAWQGEHLHGRVLLVCKLVSKGAVIVVDGAGIGAHAVPLALAVGDGGWVHAIESDPRRREILRQNLSIHGIGHASIWTLPAIPGSRSEAESGIDSLRLRRVDALLLRGCADPASRLRGAGETLWRDRSLVVVEVDDEVVMGSVAVEARRHGYRCFSHALDRHSDDNFNRRERDGNGREIALALVAIAEERDSETPPGCVELL